MNPQTCDFCGAEFDWTEDQVQLDLALRLHGSGLGACCPACDEKIVQLEIQSEDERREDERWAAEQPSSGPGWFG